LRRKLSKENGGKQLKNYLHKFYQSFSMLAMVWIIVTAVIGKPISRLSAIGILVAAVIVAIVPDEWFEKVINMIHQ
jgi:hypothetical protein